MPTFTDVRGVTISYHVWPAEAARAVVQLAHGLGEYAGRYEAIAGRLAAAGFTVYANDHRGHGQTGLAQPGGLGDLGEGGLRATIEDMAEFGALIREQNPGLPLVLLGHSWGSLMAQMLVNDRPTAYDALVLSGSAYRMPGRMAAGRFNHRWDGPGANGYEWLSRDEAVSAAFAADPLTFYADTLKVFGVPDGLRLFGRPAKNLPKGLPVYIVSGSEDPVGGEASVRALAESYRTRAGLTDVTLRVYPDARHEIFNETNRDETVGDLIDWLAEHFPAKT